MGDFSWLEVRCRAVAESVRARRAFSKPQRNASSLGSALATSRVLTWRTTASPADRPMSLGSRRASSHVPTLARRAVVNRKPKYHRPNKCKALMNVCACPIRLSVMVVVDGISRSNWDCGGEMLSKEYLDTARTILRAAQTMTDQPTLRVSLRRLLRL